MYFCDCTKNNDKNILYKEETLIYFFAVVTSAMSEDNFSLFEEKHVMRILMLVMDNPGINKTQVMRSWEGGEKAKFLKIEALIDAGYIQVVNADHWRAMGLVLTDKGKAVTKEIKRLHTAVKKANAPKDDE